jgi:transcriptional regulator with XRE-family HTH domain
MACLNPKQFGLRIRHARERLNLSQEELAGLIGKNQRSISEYENGAQRLAVTDLPRLAEALQVPLLYFFEEEGADELDSVLLEYFHRLANRETQAAAVQIVRILGELPSSTS